MQFRLNRSGGVDVLDGDKILMHLNDDDLKKLSEMRQRALDVETVRGRIPEWVTFVLEADYDGEFWADFNSHVFSDDEVAVEDVVERILADEGLIQKIVEEFRGLDDKNAPVYALYDWAETLDEAIGKHVSIKDILGDILREKHPKEFCIGKWRVAVVQQGETYGHGGAVVHEDAKPVVEFYDMSQDIEWFPNGQFTGGRYYLETLMTSDRWSESIDKVAERGSGLCLHGDVPSWTVPAGELAVIAAWLRAVQDKLGPAKEVETLDTTLAEASDRCRQGPADAEQSRDKDELTLD